MEHVKRKLIDWEKTGKNLKLLRNDNLNLRRYVCRELNARNKELGCKGADCAICKFEMDNSISQAELAQVFHVTESRIVNWENSKSKPALEDLIFYSQICGIGLFDVIVFADD